MNIAKTIDEDYAKRQWLSRLDVPTWGKGVVAPVTGVLAKSEEEAKKAWLARIETPTWGQVTSSVTELAKEALVMDQMGEDTAARTSEEEAKIAWLARLDAPSWRAVASVMATSSTEITHTASIDKKGEEEAKKEWLARLDAPSWGQAAKVMTELAHEAGAIQEMTEACDQGDESACESLSHEEVAKRAWLARLDVPTWGAAAAAVSAISTRVNA